jgi:RND family efflux transporter MFP subunit
MKTLNPGIAIISCALLSSMMADGASSATPAKAVAARVCVVEEKTVPQWSEYYGFVRSRNSVDMVALVMGHIKSVYVKAGQRVKTGELLLELDPAEIQARLQAAESRHAAAQASLTEADQRFARVKTLFPLAATKEELDAATARLKSAQAAADGAKAQVEEARESLRYTEMRSPMNGIVVDKRVNPGDFTMPGLPAYLGYPAGRVLMTIYDPDALWFEALIPERYSAAVTVGAKAAISISSAGVALEGAFVEVVPNVDEFSRAFMARVDLPPSPSLKPGMFGRARFVTGEARSIQIPAGALVARGQLDTVFLASGGKAQLRLVRGGKRTGDKVEVLSGLAAGETLIVNPAESLRDGDLVETMDAVK